MTAGAGAAGSHLDRARVRRWIAFVVALAALWSLLLLGAVLAWGGDTLDAAMATIDGSLATAVVAIFALNHALRFARWHLMLRAEGHFVPWRRSLAIFLAGLALLPTPAKAGVAVRSVMLLDAGVPVHVSLAAYFVERMLDFVGLVMLATLLVDPGVTGNRWLPGLAIGIGAIAAILVAAPACRALRPLVEDRPRFLRATDWLLKFLGDAAHMLGGWRLPAFLLLGMAANAATGLLLWIVLGAAGGPIDLAYAMGTIGVAHLSGSITLLPGGIGGFEAAMMGMLSSAGVAAGTILTGAAAVRVATLWGSVLVGLPLLYAQMRRGPPAANTGESAFP